MLRLPLYFLLLLLNFNNTQYYTQDEFALFFRNVDEDSRVKDGLSGALQLRLKDYDILYAGWFVIVFRSFGA